MFTHLLVPLDGTSQSAAVLPLVRMLAAAAGARITLVRVAPDWPDSPHGDGDFARTTLARTAAGLRRAGLRAEATIRRVLRGDQVAAAILGEARGRKADLIVMATHVRTGVARIARASVADQVLRLSPLPVLLLGPDEAGVARFDTILLPTDGTRPGDVALRPVVDLARLFGAEVVVLRVVLPVADPARPAAWPDDAPGGVAAAPGNREALADAQRQAERVAASLADLGVAAQGRAIFGRLPETILETADRLEAGLIVMSTRAKRAPAWSAPDGVALAVARRAHQPALLVRRDAELGRGAARVASTRA